MEQRGNARAETKEGAVEPVVGPVCLLARITV